MSQEQKLTAGTQDVNDNESSKGENDAGSEVVIQQPGEIIAPDIPAGYVEKIMEELYGMKVLKIQQLNGYDDKNYHVTVSPASSNPHVKSVAPRGYLLKVVNTMDTRRPSILYAQIEFMRHLMESGINTQEPVPSTQGKTVAFYEFPPPSGEGDLKTHAVCLRTFIPGSILCEVTLTPDLCYKIGEFVGSMTKALETFHHPFYDTFDCLWSMNNVSKLADYVYIITDTDDRRVVDEVMEQFCNQVLARRSEIRKGYIHGDVNEQNILVRRPAKDEDYVVAGILDFQDAAYTHPLYDLGMNLAYVMLQAITFDPLEVGGHIVAGYTTVLELPELERSMLRVTAAARLTQSLVLGAYSYSLDPTNEYLLVTAKRGWNVLHALWDTPSEVLYEMWDRIEESYRK